MCNLTCLEKGVFDFILEQKRKDGEALRRQLENISIKERIMTGVGFYTKFSVNKEKTRPLSPSEYTINLQADIDSLKFGAGFILFIEDGFINILEGFCFEGDEWPDVICGFRIY